MATAFEQQPDPDPRELRAVPPQLSCTACDGESGKLHKGARYCSRCGRDLLLASAWPAGGRGKPTSATEIRAESPPAPLLFPSPNRPPPLPAAARRPTTIRFGINRKFLALCRTIHIYLTLLGLFVMLGFGITGFTAYHEEWFHAAKTSETTVEGTTPHELIDKNDPLPIIAYVRKTYAIKGYMRSFFENQDDYSITYASPGMDWTVTITKETGATVVKRTVPNFIAVINDLHRGRSSGRAWGWVIDLSAGLIVLACITGFVLWLALPKRLKLGVASMFVGMAATLVVFFLLVPGPDNLPSPPNTSPGLFGAPPDTAPTTQPATTEPATTPA